MCMGWWQGRAVYLQCFPAIPLGDEPSGLPEGMSTWHPPWGESTLMAESPLPKAQHCPVCESHSSSPQGPHAPWLCLQHWEGPQETICTSRPLGTNAGHFPGLGEDHPNYL